MAGHLLTLAGGLDELALSRIFCPAVFTGLDSSIQLMIEAASQSPAIRLKEHISALKQMQSRLRQPPGMLSNRRATLRHIASGLDLAAATSETEIDAEWHWWTAAARQQCAAFSDELDMMAPWLDADSTGDIFQFGKVREAIELLTDVPTLVQIAGMDSTVVKTIDSSLAGAASNALLISFRAKLVAASELASKRIGQLRELAVHCRELADIEYGFLYDNNRRLLSIGYNVTDHRLDAGCYDLLASEARLASYIAIAQEKLPSEHWFSLGRSVTNVGGGTALLSWSGSMFEYLMPLLVMPTYQHTLLDETYASVVKRQISYGRERLVAWGISESEYNKTDLQGNYQYQSFGIPGLGFKRGLANDLVITPYAGAMGLMVDAPSACANLVRLKATDA